MSTEVNAAPAESVTKLYVGDIDVNVTEEELFRLFDQIGELISAKICTDETTEKSRGYGYVNYKNPEDAAKAFEDLNCTLLNGKRIRISYYNEDSSLRKSGIGNLFVKNLDKEIDHKELYELFSPFGKIVSSKVETDASDRSKGYGFVQYDNEEAAKNAIQQLNGLLLHEKKLYVGPFISKKDREMKFTNNVFVKNLSEYATEEDLKMIFGEFGSITSAVVMRDEEGNSKCFGFVNFENADDAVKSIEVLNGRVYNGKKWYVGKAQNKSEREQELKLLHEQLAKEDGLNNLYIKNLDGKIDDEKLKEMFSSFGIITSCKITYDPEGIITGSGFVAFSNDKEASKAISEMNGKMMGSKTLYVAIAERKEVRQARLQALIPNMRPKTNLPAVSRFMPVNPPGVSTLGRRIFCGQAPVLPPEFGCRQPLNLGVMTAVQLNGPLTPWMHNEALSGENAYGLHPADGLSNNATQGTTRGPAYAHENSSLAMHDNRIYPSVTLGALASALANATLAERLKMLAEIEQLEHEFSVN